MKKSIRLSIVLLGVICVLATLLISCDFFNGIVGGGYTGTYYSYSNNVKDSSDWIKLESKKWSDSSDESGRLEIKDGTIYAYYKMFGEEDVLFWGTVSDGVFKYTLGQKLPSGEYFCYKYYSDKSKAENKDSSLFVDNGKKDTDGKEDSNTPTKSEEEILQEKLSIFEYSEYYGRITITELKKNYRPIELVIPNGVTNIDRKAFADCTFMKEVIIPDSVTDIGSEAFSGCSALTTVTMRNGVKKIGDRAFKDCIKLRRDFCYARNYH